MNPRHRQSKLLRAAYSSHYTEDEPPRPGQITQSFLGYRYYERNNQNFQIEESRFYKLT